MEGLIIKIKEMKIAELDEFLENEESFSVFYWYRMMNIGSLWRKIIYLFHCFRDSVTKETIYTEQGSLLITCLQNYTGLMWEKIINMYFEYIK